MYDLKNDRFYNWWREGLQAMTYLDEDWTKVLKVFKTYEESKTQLRKWGKSEDEMSKEWYLHGFDSNLLAYEKLPEETWVLYYHDWASDIWPIVIDGQLKSSFWTPFILQKKVLLVCEKITEYLDLEDLTAAKKVVDDVFILIEQIRDKGITEDTFNYDHNYGYDENGNMLQIDIGSFWEGKDKIQKEIHDKKMFNNSTSNRLKERSEELYSYHMSKTKILYSSYTFWVI